MHNGIGFNDAKKRVTEAIQSKRFRHEHRVDAQKNLLATGELSLEEAVAILSKTRGSEASSSRHHFDPILKIWVFQPVGWYIKFYFLEECLFISFHRSE